MNPTTTDTDLDTEEEERRFLRIMVKMRINAAHGLALVKGGLELNVRSTDDEQKLIERHAEDARAHGRDPYFLNRTDRAGNLRPDSGFPVFGKDGLQRCSLNTIRGDLREEDYVLREVKLLHKEGDNMYTLLMIYLPEVEELSELDVPTTIAQKLDVMFDNNSWGFVHVWVNPDGTATVNAAHMQDANKATQRVRLNAGEFTSQSRR